MVTKARNKRRRKEAQKRKKEVRINLKENIID